MKNLFKLFAGLILGLSLLTGCSDDESNETTTKNFLKIGNTEYTLAKGTCENYGVMEDDSWAYDGYNLDLFLFSNNITIVTDSDGEMDYTGSGQVVYFEMFSSTSDAFESGDYIYSESEPYSVKTFDYSDFTIAYSDEGEYDWVYIVSGTVTITKSGSEYSISINCTGENGEAVTGFYKGSLQYFDYTVDTKSAKIGSTKKSKRNK